MVVQAFHQLQNAAEITGYRSLGSMYHSGHFDVQFVAKCFVFHFEKIFQNTSGGVLELHIDFNLLLSHMASVANFKLYAERVTCYFIVCHCQMVKAAIAQPSPSSSPTKLLEAKLLIAWAKQKAKGKKKAPTKVTKAAMKATKAAQMHTIQS
jgi:hypothetical protein